MGISGRLSLTPLNGMTKRICRMSRGFLTGSIRTFSPQRHRDTEEMQGGVPSANSRFLSSLCLCVSVVLKSLKFELAQEFLEFGPFTQYLEIGIVVQFRQVER